ncbi:P27 family phage terminase small subunit [Vagococcus vulneris]|uniref:Terminase n=1 Tax=Vagococcus vulneris TaxID=1977869 RepID=A0A429ZT88_9ENTE|nr:P27 family phage terminase small subunit [Vagococcus vulneris]RST96951.1 hypothetical protein CBF37_10365 [Vagococcus vulneris]
MNEKKVKKSLLEQLTLRNATSDFYIDLINDYMSLWHSKELLVADIKERGTVYKEPNSSGRNVSKNNPSTKELVMVNKQMLALLKDLGLNEPAVSSEPDDGELL